MIPRDVAELLDELDEMVRVSSATNKETSEIRFKLMQVLKPKIAAITAAFDPERYVRPHDGRTERGQPLSAAASRTPRDYFDIAVQNARAQAKAAEPVLECSTCIELGQYVKAHTEYGHPECPECGDRNNLRVRR